MLRITQNRSPQSAATYYSRAEYYGEGKSRSGLWGGKTAKLLGLGGDIRESDFQALCHNRDPRSGAQLTARHDQDRTVGYDFTFDVPKGVSMAYAIGGDMRIGEVFERAFQETMQEIEREAKTRVRIGGRDEDRVTGNLVWGQFTHVTTRPLAENDVDPHVHIHAFCFNVTFDEQEQRFKAVQFRDLKRDASFFEARMNARLAKYLREDLGYSIKRSGRQWDIDGLPKDLVNRFSRRTKQIEDAAEELGITSPEQKASLGEKTRNTKSSSLPFSELQHRWRQRVTAEELQLLETLANPSGSGEVNGPITTQEAVRQALLHCFERDAVVPERTVLREALRLGVGTIDVHDVQGEAFRQGLITREFNGRRMATTLDVIEDESVVLEFARQGKGSVTPLNAAWQPTDRKLGDEALNAVKQLTASPDRVQLLLGGAGTGKTTLMRTAVAAIEGGGHTVFTFAPSTKASRQVLRDEGFTSATTVAELLVNTQLQAQVQGAVIWIDESSLIGSRQLRKVVDLAERLNSRLILSGDWLRQHGSVERGGVLGLMDRYAGVTPIQIHTIRRQQGHYREAIADMAAGQIGRGFDQLDKLGWVHEVNDDDARDRQLAERYAQYMAANETTLVVAPTHREAYRIRDAIRAELRKRGLITGTDREVPTLTPLHLTEGERSHPGFLRDGDVICFHQNAKGYRKGDRVMVSGNVPRDITSQAAKYSVSRPSTLTIASGDLIRMTAGGKTKDGKHRLHNGAVYAVDSVLNSGDIRLSNGWILDAGFGHIAQGTVSTSHASQGSTVQHVLVSMSADSFAAVGKETAYVSASRGRRSCHVFTDRKQELKLAMEQSAAKPPAMDFFGPIRRLQQHRRQQAAALGREQYVQEQRRREPERTNNREIEYERTL